MSKETRYVFKMTLTPEQVKLVDDMVGWCLGIPDGERVIAEITPADGTMTVVIVPPEEAKLLDVQFRAMKQRTEVEHPVLLS